MLPIPFFCEATRFPGMSAFIESDEHRAGLWVEFLPRLAHSTGPQRHNTPAPRKKGLPQHGDASRGEGNSQPADEASNAMAR